MDSLKHQIRCLVSNIYDLQKLRISAGNRLVQSFYLKLGMDCVEDNQKVINLIKKEYDKIAEEVSSGVSVKRVLASEKAGVLRFIKDEMDYRLVNSYVL
jgi:uncharacterized radical SAM superfamily protein